MKSIQIIALAFVLVCCSKKTVNNASAPKAIAVDPNHIYTRIFDVQTNFVPMVKQSIAFQPGENMNHGFRRLLETKGLKLRPPATIFVDEERSRLMVQARTNELEQVEKLLVTLNLSASRTNSAAK